MEGLPFCCLVKLTHSIYKLQKDFPWHDLAIDFSEGCIDGAYIISALNVIDLSHLPGAKKWVVSKKWDENFCMILALCCKPNSDSEQNGNPWR